MPMLKGVTVRILCAGRPLEEYATIVNQDSPSVIGCWVASQTNQLKLLFQPHEDWGWSCKLYCDGQYMRHLAFGENDNSGVVEHAGSGAYVYPMLFSEFLTTSEEAAEAVSNPFLGTIKAEFRRIKPNWIASRSTRSRHNLTLSDTPIHETKKILGGHRVKIGEPVPNCSKKVKGTYLDAEPYVIFEFRYRPRGILQALGHAPPISNLQAPGYAPSSRSKLAAKRGRSSSSEAESHSESDDEAGEIATQIQELQERQERIRREKRFKRERKRFKRMGSDIIVPASINGKVIDLCSD
ncbi:hypothetical protein M408DRAFT_29233 [Serendipita vermifera MAFF 305830]|uniref:DUF7918 domain-containing protein n=1 Tax=Serendipita vermifera MAFF 305830 TaxID=933852 RepID=A0A0C2W5X0_SERVB|nr:hypothetical protein M408DRAFT_29233 [Serendipita vermifera MAFF 305830]